MDSSSTRLHKGILEILSIATIMTIFELPFYIFIVKPNIKLAIDSLIETMPDGNLDKRIEHLLIVLKERENIYIYDIDFGSYLLIIIEIILLLTIVRLYVNKIRQLDENVSFKNNIKLVIFVITLLIGFQVFFYFFAMNYYYFGRFGKEEIVHRFVENYKIKK